MANEAELECPVCCAVADAESLTGDDDNYKCPECEQSSPVEDWQA